MKVLVACEFSGIVRDAFIAEGHDAISCDLLPTERPGPHIQGDVRPLLKESWDLVIAQPPCTYLSNGTQPKVFLRHDRYRDTLEAINLFKECLNANSPLVAVENPQMHFLAKNLLNEPHSQIVHPWQFGHPYMKRTYLLVEGVATVALLRHTHCKTSNA